jgi:ribonuclease HI
MLVSVVGVVFEFSTQLGFHCTNNQAGYEALIFGLELLKYMGVRHVRVFGDS